MGMLKYSKPYFSFYISLYLPFKSPRYESQVISRYPIEEYSSRPAVPD